jgi:hypothetical protein
MGRNSSTWRLKTQNVNLLTKQGHHPGMADEPDNLLLNQLAVLRGAIASRLDEIEGLCHRSRPQWRGHRRDEPHHPGQSRTMPGRPDNAPAGKLGITIRPHGGRKFEGGYR